MFGQLGLNRPLRRGLTIRDAEEGSTLRDAAISGSLAGKLYGLEVGEEMKWAQTDSPADSISGFRDDDDIADDATMTAEKEEKASREIVLAAVQENGRELEFASEKLKADSEIVLAAKKNGAGAQ